jgi:predicted RNA-binding protein
MCQAKVYLDGDQIMEDVIWLEPTQDGFLVRSLFDDSREVKGKLESIDLLKHQVRLTSTAPNEPS